MIRRLAALVVAALALVAPGATAVSYPPRPAGFVADTVGRLRPETISHLDVDLAEYEARSGNEIGVAIVSTTDGTDIADYSWELFNRWQVGQQGSNNGVLLVIAIDDRRLRLQVGSGLESTLSNERAASIVDSEIVPRLKDGNLDGAVEAGVIGARRALGDDVTTPDTGTGTDAHKPVAIDVDNPSGDTVYRDQPTMVAHDGATWVPFALLFLAGMVALAMRSVFGRGGGDRCPNCGSVLARQGGPGPGGGRMWTDSCTGCGFQNSTSAGGGWGLGSIFGSAGRASGAGWASSGSSSPFGGYGSSGGSSGSIGGGGSSGGGGASGSW